jgi:hypothetical protein
VVLPWLEGKLRLEEQLLSRNEPRSDRSRDRFTHRRFMVMSPLIGRVDAAKALPNCKLRQSPRRILFPGSPV